MRLAVQGEALGGAGRGVEGELLQVSGWVRRDGR